MAKVHEEFARAVGESEFTHKALAEACGVSQPRITQLVGGGGLPSVALAMKIEEAIGFPARKWAAEAAASRTRRAMEEWSQV